jgi:hypothetical protein
VTWPGRGGVLLAALLPVSPSVDDVIIDRRDPFSLIGVEAFMRFDALFDIAHGVIGFGTP